MHYCLGTSFRLSARVQWVLRIAHATIAVLATLALLPFGLLALVAPPAPTPETTVEVSGTVT